MNVYQNRYLVVIGGETENDLTSMPKPSSPQEDDSGSASKSGMKRDKSSNESDDDDSEPKNRPLNDVWIFDCMMNKWTSMSPQVKV